MYPIATASPQGTTISLDPIVSPTTSVGGTDAFLPVDLFSGLARLAAPRSPGMPVGSSQKKHRKPELHVERDPPSEQEALPFFSESVQKDDAWEAPAQSPTCLKSPAAAKDPAVSTARGQRAKTTHSSLQQCELVHPQADNLRNPRPWTAKAADSVRLRNPRPLTAKAVSQRVIASVPRAVCSSTPKRSHDADREGLVAEAQAKAGAGEEIEEGAPPGAAAAAAATGSDTVPHCCGVGGGQEPNCADQPEAPPLRAPSPQPYTGPAPALGLDLAGGDALQPPRIGEPAAPQSLTRVEEARRIAQWLWAAAAQQQTAGPAPPPLGPRPKADRETAQVTTPDGRYTIPIPNPDLLPMLSPCLTATSIRSRAEDASGLPSSKRSTDEGDRKPALLLESPQQLLLQSLAMGPSPAGVSQRRAVSATRRPASSPQSRVPSAQRALPAAEPVHPAPERPLPQRGMARAVVVAIRDYAFNCLPRLESAADDALALAAALVRCGYTVELLDSDARQTDPRWPSQGNVLQAIRAAAERAQQESQGGSAKCVRPALVVVVARGGRIVPAAKAPSARPKASGESRAAPQELAFVVPAGVHTGNLRLESLLTLPALMQWASHTLLVLDVAELGVRPAAPGVRSAGFGIVAGCGAAGGDLCVAYPKGQPPQLAFWASEAFEGRAAEQGLLTSASLKAYLTSKLQTVDGVKVSVTGSPHAHTHNYALAAYRGSPHDLRAQLQYRRYERRWCAVTCLMRSGLEDGARRAFEVRALLDTLDCIAGHRLGLQCHGLAITHVVAVLALPAADDLQCLHAHLMDQLRGCELYYPYPGLSRRGVPLVGIPCPPQPHSTPAGLQKALQPYAYPLLALGMSSNCLLRVRFVFEANLASLEVLRQIMLSGREAAHGLALARVQVELQERTAQHVAAMRVQASWRGHRVRRLPMNLRWLWALLQECLVGRWAMEQESLAELRRVHDACKEGAQDLLYPDTELGDGCVSAHDAMYAGGKVSSSSPLAGVPSLRLSALRPIGTKALALLQNSRTKSPTSPNSMERWNLDTAPRPTSAKLAIKIPTSSDLY